MLKQDTVDAVQLCYVNPLIEEVYHVFAKMLGWVVECEYQKTKTDWAPTEFASAVISLHGGIEGKIVLGFPSLTACRLTESLLKRPYMAVNDDVADAICELTNTVSGRAAPCLSQQCTRVGVPEAIIGRGQTIDYSEGTVPVVIGFHCEAGTFVLELGLRKGAATQEHGEEGVAFTSLSSTRNTITAAESTRETVVF
jgi:CheY-specific phosphatase CheX